MAKLLTILVVSWESWCTRRRRCRPSSAVVRNHRVRK